MTVRREDKARMDGETPGWIGLRRMENATGLMDRKVRL